MRYEYKYIIPNSKLNKLREMISPFVEVDKFAEASSQNQYSVRSIYFDTSNFDFYYEKIEGIKNRKKVRLRGYNDEDMSNIVFLEIKRKYDIPIMKFRAPVRFGEALEMFKLNKINGQILLDQGLSKSDENAKRFFYQMYSKNLRPVVLVVYEREAYHSKFDHTVRITFDKNLRASAYPTLNDLYSEKGMKSVLNDKFILEVKFNKHFPGWLNPVISQLELRKQSASKYCMSIDTNDLVKNLTKSTMFTRSKWFNSQIKK